MTDSPVVSVVIAAYQVERYVQACLDSVLAQTIGFDRLEVIAVDDGSTDRTGELLDAFASGRPNVHVLHQANSGGPGGPRNRGIVLSRGEYVFILDPDDHLGPEALERMVAMARRNDSDVVLGRIVGVGRNAPRSPFRKDVERGDVWSVNGMWSMHSQKLYRRTLLVDHAIRFPEGVRVSEDAPFVTAAYLSARVISVVASYPCYYLVLRSEGGNATRSEREPEPLFRVLGAALDLIDSRTPPGPQRDELKVRFLVVEIALELGSTRLLARTPEQRREVVEHARPVVLRHYLQHTMSGYAALDRLRAHFIAQGDVQALTDLARFEVYEPRQPPVVEQGRVYARYPCFGTGRAPVSAYDITDEVALDHCREHVAWTGTALEVSVTPLTPALQSRDAHWAVQLHSRTRDDVVHVPAVSGSDGRLLAALDLAGTELAGRPDDTWALSVAVTTPDGRAAKQVGTAATLADLPHPPALLVGDRLVTLHRNRRLQLLLRTSGQGGRLGAVVTSARTEQDGTLALTGVLEVSAPSTTRGWSAQLLLRSRRSGQEFSSVATLHHDGLDWCFSSALRATALPEGVWDASLQVVRGRVRHEARLRPAGPGSTTALAHAGSSASLYRTRAGWASLAVEDVAATLSVAAEVLSVIWVDGALLRVRVRRRTRSPAEVSVQRSVLFRDEAGHEVAVPDHAEVGDGEVELDLPLSRVAGGRGLPVGRWSLWLRVELGGVARETELALPVRKRPVALPPERRRYRRGLSVLVARVRRRDEVLRVVVGREPTRRTARRVGRRVARRWRRRLRRLTP